MKAHAMRVVTFLVLVGGYELVGAGETIHDEIVARAVQAAVDDRGDHEKETEDECGACAHWAIVVEVIPRCHPSLVARRHGPGRDRARAR